MKGNTIILRLDDLPVFNCITTEAALYAEDFMIMGREYADNQAKVREYERSREAERLQQDGKQGSSS